MALVLLTTSHCSDNFPDIDTIFLLLIISLLIIKAKLLSPASIVHLAILFKNRKYPEQIAFISSKNLSILAFLKTNTVLYPCLTNFFTVESVLKSILFTKKGILIVGILSSDFFNAFDATDLENVKYVLSE